MAEQELVALSMDPDDFIRGGLLSDVDVEFTGAVYCVWDYGGKVNPGVESVLALRCTMKDMESGEEMDQYWSAGNASNFTILDENGVVCLDEGVSIASTTKAGVNDSSNIFHLFRSLKQHGFKRELLVSFKSSCLIGLQAHVVRDAAPKRPGLKQEPAQEGREKTILVVSKIIRLPGEKTKKKKAPTKKAAGATTAAATTDAGEEAGDDTTSLGVTVITALLEAEGVIPYKGLKVRAIKHMATNKIADAPQRNPISSMIAKEEWLVENGFLVDDGSVMSAE